MKNVILLEILLLCAGLIQADASTSKNITTTKLRNGCSLMRSTTADPMHYHMSMPYPFVNCSYMNRETFDLSDLPNDTVSISLSYNMLNSFNIDELTRFRKLTKLDLRHNILETVQLSKTTPKITTLRHVYLAYNKLTSVPSEALKIIPNLAALDLSGNKIKRIEDKDFAYSTKISMLSLGSNPLEYISPKAWTNLTNTIYALSMQFAGLKEVPDFIADMSKIIYLSLANNKISNIQANAFKGATALRWVELAGNTIKRLDQRAFAGAEKLRLVDLSDNLLETLPSGVFDSLHDEEQISVELYENPLRCNSSLKWLKLWTDDLSFQDVRYTCEQPKRNHGKKAYQLEAEDFDFRLDDEDWIDNQNCSKSNAENSNSEPEPTPLSGGNICPKQCKCFDAKGAQYYPSPPAETASNKKLRRLWWLGKTVYPHVDCSNAGLTKLPDKIRADVKTLTLAENKLGTLNIADIKKFKSLETLDLEGCSLTRINPDKDSTFEFENMTILSIHHNNLTSFGAEQLHCFPNLRVLRMYNNKITTLHRGMFQNNKRINRLYIGPNPIKKFDPKCLEGLNLYALSLRNTSLKQIPIISAKNLTYLELSDNLITTIQNNTFINMPSLFRMTLDNNIIRIIQSNAFRNLKALRYLDISENKIRTLPKGVFDDMDKDKIHVELWMNQINCDCSMKWFKEWIEKLEETNPMTEIRFMCSTPVRLHGKVSDKLKPVDFTCDSKDKKYVDEEEVNDDYYEYIHGKCYSQGQLALAIILTIVCMLLLILLAKCCNARRKGGYLRYKAHNDSHSQLDMDI